METADSPALLLLDLPPSALAGIDFLAFTTTPRFKGVKNLPPGLHFTYVGSSTAFSERHGLWFRIDERSNLPGDAALIVTRWDVATEVLLLEVDTTTSLRWRANLGSIWREGLTPYRQSAAAPSTDLHDDSIDWTLLTSAITDVLLDRVTGTINHTLASASSAKRDLEDIPGLTSTTGPAPGHGELHFLPIDLKQTWRAGATGRERTTAAQDRSWALDALISTHCTRGGAAGEEVLGELQFCFLMVLTLNNFSCLEQWRRLLTLLLTCRAVVAKRAALFVAVLSTLRRQLQHCQLAENGLIDLADEGGSLLRDLLSRFRRSLDTLASSGSMGLQHVVDALDELETYLGEEHGWQFGGSFAKSGVLELEDGEEVRGVETTAFDEEDETGEYAPVMVELTAEQERMLGESAELGWLHEGMGKATLQDQKSRDDDDDDDDDEEEEEEEEEEMQDLDEMDSRY